MRVRTVRRLVVIVCACSVAGMIATSIADNTDGALAFGLLSVAAVVGLLLVTAVTEGPAEGADDRLAEQVEAQARALVAAGAEEAAVRALIGDAVRFGRARR